MSASLVARNDLPFDASLWTQNAEDSPEVFVYDVTIGEEEVVAPSNSQPTAHPQPTKIGRNEPCYCG